MKISKQNNFANSTTHYFQLTGLHPILPLLEIKSILTSEKTEYKIVSELEQCLIANCSSKLAVISANRAAHCRRAVKLLYQNEVLKSDYLSIADEISSNIDFTQFLKASETFLVRVYRIADASKKLISTPLEVEIGKRIWKQMNGKCNVKMDSPDKTFVLLFTEDQFLFGLQVYSRKTGAYTDRRPDIRPFFKPGTLEPRFARMMVNLAQAQRGEYLLDPFCGPGGILIEAAMLNCNVIGVDIDKRMIKGARKNLEHYSVSDNFELLIGDARELPIRNKIASIVTDPPYGKSTSTYGKKIQILLHQFLEEANKIMKQKGLLAIGMLSEIPLEEIADEQGFKLEIFEKIYIHRSLTRRVGVFRKK